MDAQQAVRSSEYEFEPRYEGLADGRMHYVDEGRGPTVVLVHGTPTWSFLYRRLIGALSARHRVIAPDHLGSGRSDKPPHADYRPEAGVIELAGVGHFPQEEASERVEREVMEFLDAL